ncbi:guanine nucleotide-binding protein G(I)/G(S)/G(O) subunit gamma-12 isoform X1 [Anabas testudineus]|uniref:Guanine nucleotide-binding protein subunit gamma n=4 Tax=Percomorphaceae TaxID=1489872 RepID=A0A7N6AH90_ANATE|nr:guanine nucleotide-binding protein G(I)/G(S)/G(O) subunit gamma-12 isoform X1 [Anabas testudineus]
MVLSSVCSRFCSCPCFISLPCQRIPLLRNILHQSKEQTRTTPHVKDYFGQSQRATFWFEHGCPKIAMSSKMQSSSSIAQARRTVQQLRIEASIERIKVSKASSDLMRYCGEHAKNDPLLMGIPASENPFKDKKPCTVL